MNNEQNMKTQKNPMRHFAFVTHRTVLQLLECTATHVSAMYELTDDTPMSKLTPHSHCDMWAVVRTFLHALEHCKLCTDHTTTVARSVSSPERTGVRERAPHVRSGTSCMCRQEACHNEHTRRRTADQTLAEGLQTVHGTSPLSPL
jgi:hypothetical protein